LTTDKQLGLQAATRWLKNKFYGSHSGSPFGTTARDPAFYSQISKDHDAWRKKGGPTQGNPVDNPELAEKLLWRRGNEIVESPNINDLVRSRDANQFTWENLMKDDAERAAKSTVKLLASRRFNGSPSFEKWANNPDNMNGMITHAWTRLTTLVTGAPPEEYRSEKKRISWANAAIEKYIDDYFVKQATGQGGKGADDAPDAIDLARSKDSSDTVNTGIRHHRSDDEEPAGNFVMPKSDEFDGGVKPILSGDEAEREAERIRQQAQNVSQQLRKPAHISVKDWLRMTPEQRRAATQS